MKKEKGNVGELLATGLCMLGMTVLMLSYMKNAGLIRQKTEVSQIARKYILRMETVGRLTDGDRIELMGELDALGVAQPRLDGTTLGQVDFGEPIVLQIQGKLGKGYDFTEKRVSTAKH